MRTLLFAVLLVSTAHATSIDKEPIRAEIRTHLDAIKSCYDRELADDPELTGRVVVQFVISHGRVPTAVIRESSLPPTSSTAGCIASAATTWRFDRRYDDMVLVISYPFVLQTNERPDGAAKPMVSSGLTTEQVEAVFRSHESEARSCGRPATVDVLVAPSGKAEIGVTESSPCLRAAVRGWSFPASDAPTRFAHVSR